MYLASRFGRRPRSQRHIAGLRRRISSVAARRLSLEPLEDRRLLSIELFGVPTWDAQGPESLTSSTGVRVPGNHVSGAIQAIAVHPQNAEVVYVGTVNGGAWRETERRL